MASNAVNPRLFGESGNLHVLAVSKHAETPTHSLKVSGFKQAGCGFSDLDRGDVCMLYTDTPPLCCSPEHRQAGSVYGTRYSALYRLPD